MISQYNITVASLDLNLWNKEFVSKDTVFKCNVILKDGIPAR